MADELFYGDWTLGEEWGEYSYLPDMAAKTYTGAPVEVFLSMGAKKTGDFTEELQTHVATLGLNGDDPLVDYIPPSSSTPGLGTPASAQYIDDFFDPPEDDPPPVAVQPYIAPSLDLQYIDDFFDPPEDDPLAGYIPPAVLQPEAGTPLPSDDTEDAPPLVDDFFDPPGVGPNTYPYPLTIEEGLVAEDVPAGKTKAAEAATQAAADQLDIFNALNAAYPDIGAIRELMDKSGLTESDIQDWVNWEEWRGDEDFRDALAKAGLYPFVHYTPEEQKRLGEMNWYQSPAQPDGTVDRKYMSVREFEHEGYKGMGWKYAVTQSPPPAIEQDDIENELVTEAELDDLLETLKRDGDQYEITTENLRARFFTTIYQQPGVGYATQAELDDLRYHTQLLFFLEQGEKAWQNIEQRDAPALEGNYQTYLDEYLTRPFAQRLGSDFYSLVKDVSRIFAKSQEWDGKVGEPKIETWDLDDQNKKIWVDGLFGEGKHTARDTLVKLGLTHGGMGYFSRQIHNAAQAQMDYYRNIGWSEARIFDHMTKGIKKSGVGDDPLDDLLAGSIPSTPPAVQPGIVSPNEQYNALSI